MTTLPIFDVKEKLIDTIRANPVTIVRGSTGSGKTTQLPIMLSRSGFAKTGAVIIAEPRRAAAINVAEYVARELRESLGNHVGYRVRFNTVGNRHTSIQFVTMGIVLREILNDPLLPHCSTLVIDEVHESSTEGDLLVSLARTIIKERPDFRLVLMSATLDVSGYSAYFNNAPVIDIPGRTYPITTHYLKQDIHHIETLNEKAADMALGIDQKGEKGDILIFLPGRESIEAVIDIIALRGEKHIVVLPLYKDLEAAEQKKVYQSFPGCRKIVVATNIAETSITIEGIKYVIDSGLIKNNVFSEESGVQSLLVEKHSQSGCEQRSGRSGRTGPGVCYRMFTQKSFEKRPLHSVPEIVRANPASMILYLQNAGHDVQAFDFIHKPSPKLVARSEEDLAILGALSVLGKHITRLGKNLANLPLEPHVGKLLIESIRMGCVREVVTFASFLSRTAIFLRPYGKAALAEKAQAAFINPTSEALTILNVWIAYATAGYSRAWCREYFINIQAMEEAKLVRDQLSKMLLAWRIPITHGNEETFLRCVTSGLRFNLLKRDTDGYRGIFRNVTNVRLLPLSPLKRTRPQYIVAADLLKTKYCYALYATETKEAWLRECIPNFDALIASSAPRMETSEPEPEASQAAPEKLKRSSVVSYSDPRLYTLVFTAEGQDFVTTHKGQRILKTSKWKVEPGKPYQCRIVKVLDIPFAEVVAEGPVEKPVPDSKLVGMAESLATKWGCNFKTE
ncbi:MAG: helicase-related protein [bacterium]|nr:helicase-related protein [bacterium]